MNLLLMAMMLLLPVQPQGAAPATFRVHGKVTGVPADAASRPISRHTRTHFFHEFFGDA